jgi:hypothetical protein
MTQGEIIVGRNDTGPGEMIVGRNDTGAELHGNPENGTFFRTKSGSFGSQYMVLLETFILLVGNQKFLFYNFNTATNGGLKNRIFEKKKN